MKTVAERILVIRHSLQCYLYGWCSFIPLAGIPVSVLALLSFRKARAAGAGEWNPARVYLNWGIMLAALGGFISTAVFGLLIFTVIKSIE